jgi:hypothetical protein
MASTTRELCRSCLPTRVYSRLRSPVEEKKLSSEGRELIDDFRNIIETALKMVKQKNADELFQNFLYCELPRRFAYFRH